MNLNKIRQYNPKRKLFLIKEINTYISDNYSIIEEVRINFEVRCDTYYRNNEISILFEPFNIDLPEGYNQNCLFNVEVETLEALYGYTKLT